MTRSDRKTTHARSRPTPMVERLEGRALLNATPITHPVVGSVHAEVEHPKAHAVKATTHAKAHQAKTVHSPVVTTLGKAVTGHATAATTRVVKGHHRLIDIAGDGGVGSSSDTDGSPQVTYSPLAGSYGPTQLATAYGVNLLGLANQGQGVTIGIVDEFDDPNITGDANVYSAQYGLPQFDGVNGDPSMVVYKDTALGAVTSIVGTGVGGETSLDVEMAHAMAPKANILLVEVPATGTVANEFVQLLHGGQAAAGMSVNGAPVVVVSTSYGYAEGSIGNTNVVNDNNTYLAAGAATNVAMTFSTGDGSSPLFPATSPNVIGVGGTALYFSSARGRYSYEVAWGGLANAGAGGGGLSTNFAAPTFQANNSVVYSKRAIPDVSMNADVVTAASVYDSIDVTTSAPDPWTAFGGTSEATPLFSGILALAQQDRLAAGKAILTSVQINGLLYSAYTSPSYSTLFHDITLGNNSNVNSRGRTTVTGFNATTGYDLATGIGSPIANTLVPYLTNS